MLFLAFIFKRGDGYGGHAVLRSLIALQTPRRNLYTPVYNGAGLLRFFLSVLFLDGAFYVALCGALSHILALVIELFALAQAKLHLNSAVLEVQ